MAVMSKFFVLALMMAVLMLLAAVLGSARRLEGEKWTAAGEVATPGDHGHPIPILEFAKHLYPQQLAASCGTNDPNNPACHQH
ncbi:hypothetical protein BS78_05G016800 [Paspalum vaginatum]|nr:hypothetical protein BS78_05G016800 [Paspalum vaginatum]